MTGWLDRNNLHAYTELLHVERISLRLLAIMTQEELRDLGISSFGDRKRFLAAIARKRQEIYQEYIDLLIELEMNTLQLEGAEATPGGSNTNGGTHSNQHTGDANDQENECQFEDSEAFTRVFEGTDSLLEFNKYVSTSFICWQHACGAVRPGGGCSRLETCTWRCYWIQLLLLATATQGRLLLATATQR
jgi:hypothetical protein